MFAKIKIRFMLISLVAIVLTFTYQESLAYYTTVGKATSVITAGDIRLLIHETTDKGTPFPSDGICITPGDVVSKQVSIENDCDEPFYLRVKPVYDIDSATLSVNDCFKLDIDSTHWKYVDGWYYYTEILLPGQTTANFFTQVEIVGSEVNNSYLGKTLELTVIAQAVQSKNNPVNGNETYTASGWPMA